MKSEYIYYRVYEYIANEINYIKEYDMNNYYKDLVFLESLNDDDIRKICGSVLGDGELESEIERMIDENIHYYLYHYKKGDEL